MPYDKILSPGLLSPRNTEYIHLIVQHLKQSIHEDLQAFIALLHRNVLFMFLKANGTAKLI